MREISFGSRSSQNTPSLKKSDSGKSVDEILEQAMQILAQKAEKPKYAEPMRRRLYVEYLCNEDKKFDVVRNFYSNESNIIVPDAFEMISIIHGHGIDKGCASPYFCHEMGYSPTGEEHPAFLKLIKQKWNNL